MNIDKNISVILGVVLLIMGLIFIGQGVYYIIMKNRERLPKKMLVIGIMNIIIGVFSIAFSVGHLVMSSL